MNYKTATDLELNEKLTELVLAKRYPRAKSIEFDGRQHCFWVDNAGFSSFPVVDYCADWHATMPLAMTHNIYVRPSTYGGYTAEQMVVHSRAEYSTVHHTGCAYPLRAIVICLIALLERLAAHR